MRSGTSSFLSELVKLAYGWGAINKVSSMAKKLMAPKALRTRLDSSIGSFMGTKGGKLGTYMAIRKPDGTSGMLTPGSGGVGKMLRGLTRSKGFTGAPERTPYQTSAIDALKRTRMNGPQQRAVNSVVHGHELDELTHAAKRGRKGLDMSPVTKKLGHQSPDVLLREHNRLATLPSEVRAPVTDVMKKMRAASGDTDVIENGFKGRFNFGDSPRLSRHARRRMTESLERRYTPEAG